MRFNKCTRYKGHLVVFLNSPWLETHKNATKKRKKRSTYLPPLVAICQMHVAFLKWVLALGS
jgi:hypothetical protein